MTQTRRIITLAHTLLLAVLLTAPLAATAYMDPWDVLFADELSLPADGRNSQARVERQQNESAARREREQAVVFAEQNPPVQEELAADSQEQFFASAPDTAPLESDAFVDREMLTLVRTLQRVQREQEQRKATQQVLSILQQEGLHSGAPLLDINGGKGFLPTGSKGPLYPTGMESVVAAFVLLGAIFWTMRRARQSELRTTQL